ncbi:MAG: replicative DNA helicase, partial [Patescibacteria group bacterium]
MKKDRQVVARNYLDIGKIPPSAIELEEAVLGAIMLETDRLNESIQLLSAEIFYKEANQIIFTACKALFTVGMPVDYLTVINKLKSTGQLEIVGGPYYITQLTAKVASSANQEYHIRIITEKFLKREQIKLGSETIDAGYDDETDVFNAHNELENKISKLNTYIIGKDFEGNIATDTEKAYTFITTPRAQRLMGITTGNQRLNSITGGWNDSDMVIICGRPSHGKTTRVLNFILQAAYDNKKVAFFSLEMSKQSIITKLLSCISGIDSHTIKFQEWSLVESDMFLKAKEKLKTLPIYINDKSGISPNYIRTVCRERKRKYGLDIVFIDYLQLMYPSETYRGQNEESKTAEISKAIKTLAKQMNIPIVIVSQLSREPEARQNKRPMLSD